MDCPKCKYPNAVDATHCGMCYEILHHSAAQSYARQMRRERMIADKEAEGPSTPPVDFGKAFQAVTPFLEKLDFAGAKAQFKTYARLHKKPIFISIGLAVAVTLFFLLSSFSIHILAYNLGYRFSAQKPVHYLVGFHLDSKSWSEKQGQLDTPLEKLQIDEIGNVEVASTPAEKGHTLLVRTAEWIKMAGAEQDMKSLPLPANHSSLEPATIVLDKKGAVIQRKIAASPRLGKSALFTLPVLPKGGLRPGREWVEPVQWVDMIGEWKIGWTGQLRWKLIGDIPCGRETCLELKYDAFVTPQLWSPPEWARGGVGKMQHSVSPMSGQVIFDSDQGQLLANNFTYHGVFRIPLDDLGLIPDDLRVGRSVHSVPGEVIMEFKNRIDVRRN